MFPKSDGAFLLALLLLLTSLQCAITYPQPNVSDIQPEVAQLPTSLWIDPPRLSVDAGDLVNLTCMAFRGYPSTTLSWHYGEKRILLQGTTYHQSQGPTDLDYTTLVFKSNLGDNGGTIYCIASNPLLNETKETSVNLTVLAVKNSIRIEPETVNVVNGTAAHMRCIVVSDEEHDTIQWFRSGKQLAASSVYTIDPITPPDNGVYTCVAHLASGKTLQANVTVNVISLTEGVIDSETYDLLVNDTLETSVSDNVVNGDREPKFAIFYLILIIEATIVIVIIIVIICRCKSQTDAATETPDEVIVGRTLAESRVEDQIEQSTDA